MKARKRFGQNFLRDNNVIENIVRSINPKPGEHIVEIGPGHGAITELILKSGCKLDVIEIDRDLVFDLRLKYPDLNVIESDILKFDFGEYYAGKRIRVIGNLPYNISTPLLFKLFKHAELVVDMHFMLQLEVVDRMAASASTSDYGRLSIMTQIYCETEKLFDVPPTAFIPAPKVMSAIVRLKPHASMVGQETLSKLEQLLLRAFSQRRKKISNALKGFIDTDGLETLNLSPALRPENLDIEDYLRIAEYSREDKREDKSEKNNAKTSES